MYVWGYELVSDIPVLLDDMLVFGADFIINNLEVELVPLSVRRCIMELYNAMLSLSLLVLKGVTRTML